MADKKISALDELTQTGTSDLLHVIDTSSTLTNKKITVGNVFKKIPNWIGFGDPVEVVESGSSPLTVDKAIHQLNGGTSAIVEISLPDGVQGQIKHIFASDTTNTVSVRPSNLGGSGTVITFTENSGVTLVFISNYWWILGSHGVTVS